MKNKKIGHLIAETVGGGGCRSQIWGGVLGGCYGAMGGEKISLSVYDPVLTLQPVYRPRPVLSR